MSLLFNCERHETITANVWNENQVKIVIQDILTRTDSALTEKLWLPHKNEDSEASVNKGFYFGAAGTLWGLLYLARRNNFELSFSPQELINRIHRLYLEEPDTGSSCPSFFLGEVGILLLKYKIEPKQPIATRLFDLIQNNIQNPCVDSLWGCPGTMLPALFLYEWTNDVRWKQLYLENVEHLFQSWKFDEPTGAWYWEYVQKNKVVPFIGSGHGYFGNIFPVLKGLKFLSVKTRELIIFRTIQITKKFAVIENESANWPVVFFNNKLTKDFLLQWCHGAPGMIQSLGSIPTNLDEEFDQLFVRAGELIWNAGPLKKGIGLCHGTDGNGMSLLALHRRTRDELWLRRARMFAMHSIERLNGRYSLWTGELGLACFLQACLDEEAFFPGLDFF